MGSPNRTQEVRKGEQEALRNIIRDKDCYSNTNASTSTMSSTRDDFATKIKEAKRLLDQKLISQDEFNKIKRKILGLN